MRSLLYLILALLIAGKPAVASNHNAWSAFERGEYETALQKFQVLAEQGSIEALYNLGLMYVTGKGVAPDPAEASKWFEKAATVGDAPAQNYLGYLMSRGEGMPQNYSTAAKWYFLAATQGHPRAQYNLGRFYYMGMGVPKDYVQAYKWFSLAASQGVAYAAKGMDIVLKIMPPDDILKAKGLAANWKPKQSDTTVTN